MTPQESALPSHPADTAWVNIEGYLQALLSDIDNDDDLVTRRTYKRLSDALDSLSEEVDRLRDIENAAVDMWECPCKPGDCCDCSVTLGWCVVTSPVWKQRQEATA